MGVKKFSVCGLLLLGLLAGCGNSSGPVTVTDSAEGPLNAINALAGRCTVLKMNGRYVVRDGTAFAASATDTASAEKFFMRAAGLGRYIFYTSDERWMTGSGSAVSAATAPSDGADWTVEQTTRGFTAKVPAGQFLALGSGDALVMAATPTPFEFETAGTCTAYPEMPTGIDAPTYKTAAGQPVIGYAEVHAHMSMGSDMSDGSGTRGPSAGGVMYGQAVNRFGIVEAMKNCEALHGPNGTSSAENVILDQDPTQTHDTVGWPTFVDWPKRDSQLHAQMYYRWLERAYKSGLRVMVNLGTNIEALCDIGKNTLGDRTADCTDMGVGIKQVEYMTDMQNYIDAQEGGPGKGWYRIVKTPAEARAVIAQGKLAAIPGLEFSNLFKCNVTYLPGGGETSGCTRADIDRQIDEIWDLGVRAVFPYHDVDSSLGGTGIFSSVLNLVGFYGTRGFWKTYPCDEGGEGPTFFYEAGAVLPGAPLVGNDPISQALIDNAQGTLPIYGGGRQCNARTVTDLGRYAIDKIMKKGFTIDIDHAEIRSKQIMLDEARRFTPNYPMISGHGGHGGISNAQAEQMIRQGGIIYPGSKNGKDYKDFLEKLKPIWAASGTSRPIAIGVGNDATGLANLAGPRGLGSTPVRYPFTLFQGPGWGPQYAAAGIAPLRVDQLSIPGGQSWDVNETGMAHYGLQADIVEEIRIEGGTEATDALYRSAETYLQLWEQTLAASAEARKVASPP